MESAWAKDHTALMYDWYTKGWIHPDAGLSTFNTGELRNAGKFFIEPQPAVELPAYIDALKVAGLDTVKAEVEKQYEEWKAGQGE